MPVDRDELVSYLDAYLAASEDQDFGPNGLQIEGRREIRKIVTGVSSCQELHERAVDAGADAVMVHHGVFWSYMPHGLTGMTYRRVAPLIRHDVNLLAYHLPLDRHPEVGNNAVAARALGLTNLASFCPYEGRDIGFCGRFPEPLPVAELTRRLAHFYQREPLLQGAGPDLVATLGIVSGGAQKEVYQAIERGLDAYVTGEVSEWVMNVARESGIHFFSCGHYATERCGIRALGDHVAARFGVEVEHVDIPNPV